jgi:hypothetical protein
VAQKAIKCSGAAFFRLHLRVILTLALFRLCSLTKSGPGGAALLHGNTLIERVQF